MSQRRPEGEPDVIVRWDERAGTWTATSTRRNLTHPPYRTAITAMRMAETFNGECVWWPAPAMDLNWRRCESTFLGWSTTPPAEERTVPGATRRCTVEGCDQPHKAKDLCALHYKRAAGKPPCSVDGCERQAKTDGMCKAHYTALVAPLPPPPPPPPPPPANEAALLSAVADAWRAHRPTERRARESLGLTYAEWAPLFAKAKNWGLV